MKFLRLFLICAGWVTTASTMASGVKSPVKLLVKNTVFLTMLACEQINLERVYIGGEVVTLRGEVMGCDFDRVADEFHRRAKAAREKNGPV